jgi:hypothetical protein
MIKRIILIFLIVSIFMTGPNVKSINAWSWSSGFIDIESAEWWYSPMDMDTGEYLSCIFQSEGGAVEHFIVHANDYVEYSTITENELLYHGISASDSFSLVAPGDGDWYWVFINIGANSTRVHWEWEAEDAPRVFTLFDVGLVSFGIIGIVIVAVIIHLRMKGKSSA